MRSRALVRHEDIFERKVKGAQDPEDEGKTWIVFAGLDCIYCIGRYIQATSQVRLSPPALRTKHSQPVLHELSEAAPIEPVSDEICGDSDQPQPQRCVYSDDLRLL